MAHVKSPRKTVSGIGGSGVAITHSVWDKASCCLILSLEGVPTTSKVLPSMSGSVGSSPVGRVSLSSAS